MGGEPGAIVDQIPAKVGSKLLDYYRNDRKLPRATSETAEASSAQAPTPASEPVEQTVQKQVGLTQPEMSMRGPHDYPTIVTWLKTCEEDIERGRDGHEYSKLSSVFAENECTRIDDIARMSADTIKSLATEAGIAVTIGLVNRAYQYAVEDVARVKSRSRVSF